MRIIFDLDGTIFSSEAVLGPAYAYSIKRLNDEWKTEYRTPETKEILSLVGRPGAEIVASLFPEMPATRRTELLGMILPELIRRIRLKEGKIFPGVPETLRKLIEMGHALAIASNCRRTYLESILETYELTDYFFRALCNEDFPSEGKSGIVRMLLDGQKGVMVGDRISDGEAAKKNGIPWIGCAFGHASDEVSNASEIVTDFPAIARCLALTY